MEWDALLADLESRFDAERRAELAAASADLAEAELAGIRILDRLRNAVGAELHMRTLSGFAVDGRLLRAGGEVLIIDEGEAPDRILREIWSICSCSLNLWWEITGVRMS